MRRRYTKVVRNVENIVENTIASTNVQKIYLLSLYDANIFQINIVVIRRDFILVLRHYMLYGSAYSNGVISTLIYIVYSFKICFMQEYFPWFLDISIRYQ